MARAYQREHGLVVDGKVGPATAATMLGPGTLKRPESREELIQVFGDPGQKEPLRSWEIASIVECHERGDVPPLPGAPAGRWIKVHRLIEPILRAALADAASSSSYRPERFGCYNWRHQRHDPTCPLSLHSWGIAFDIDPQCNRARSFSPGECPKPFSAAWRELWPRGIPREWVDALESRGFVWGGRWSRYCDPMHFQYAD